MKKTASTRLRLGAMLAILATGSAHPQAPSDSATPSASTDPVPAPVPAQTFVPGLSDLMSMLIQPRHLKLYYAGSRKNWELAAYEARNLRNSFARITRTIPTYLNRDLDESVKGLLAPQMQAVDAAIATADVKAFSRAYANLTAACNACHAYLEHPFVIIRVPDNSKQSDQMFDRSP